MKKKLPIIIGVIVAIGIIIFSIIVDSDSPVKEKINENKYKDIVDIIDKNLSDYKMEHRVDDDLIGFSNDDYRVYYYIDDNKIKSVDISIYLNDNTLSGEETFNKINDFYKLITNNFSSLKLYINKDLLEYNNYSLNEYDKNHLIDLIDYKETYSDWRTYYTFNKTIDISYSLYTKYDNEGYSVFYINISNY